MIATRDLMRAAGLGEDADIDVLDISTRDGKWNQVFRLAGGRAGMTPDATGVVNNLGPFDTLGL
ncbi:MAG: hypothetical protein ACRD6N_00040 [Pyrinomonadaceae bacterium]